MKRLLLLLIVSFAGVLMAAHPAMAQVQNPNVNIARIAGLTVVTGAGTSTGSIRVTQSDEPVRTAYGDGTPTATTDIAAVQGSASSGSVPGNPVATCALSGTTCVTLTKNTANGGGLFVEQRGYTVIVNFGTSHTAAVTNAVMVAGSGGNRIVVHAADWKCGSTVTAASTMILGFGTASTPASGAKVIMQNPSTTASSLTGSTRGTGWPGVIGSSVDGDSLFMTTTGVTGGGSCTLDLIYHLESTS